MDRLADSERKILLDSTRKIYSYKLMQVKGYERLINKSKDERIRQILTQICTNELNDTEYWSQSIAELDKDGKPISVPFLNQRIRLMMGILGTRGFFEWAIIAEDESIDDLAICSGNIGDQITSEKWTRIASDERLHIERVKNDILGMEGWEMGGGGGVRDVIFGANDGLVSILALVAGVYGAITESHPILIAGVAGAVAGAISIGAGTYLSSKSEQEGTENERERQGVRKKGTGTEVRDELLNFYQKRGFKR